MSANANSIPKTPKRIVSKMSQICLKFVSPHAAVKQGVGEPARDGHADAPCPCRAPGVQDRRNGEGFLVRRLQPPVPRDATSGITESGSAPFFEISSRLSIWFSLRSASFSALNAAYDALSPDASRRFPSSREHPFKRPPQWPWRPQAPCSSNIVQPLAYNQTSSFPRRHSLTFREISPTRNQVV